MTRARHRRLQRRRARNHRDLAIIPVVLIIGLAVAVTSTPRYTGFAVTGNVVGEAQMDAFVDCLNRKGVVVYISYGDPQSEAMEAMYGDRLNTVQCRSDHIAYDEYACQKRNINVVPTTYYRGQYLYGYQSPYDLGKITNCA